MMDWLLGEPLGGEGYLVWGADTNVIMLAVVLGVAAVVMAVRRGQGRYRLLEIGLWSAAVLIAVVSLADPMWVEESGRTVPGRSVVLVDGSRSMGVFEGTERE